ncbi:fibrinogen C domain-containing protein 1-like isoform X2 [Syngnathus acus]|uniref:fibrinogen C domain-containing protein 1-like isoform X2 n=1 Tax=Syngnathus acus TaxID=161584 RepID=UPI001885C5C5|nr:fibrinogen C domain-containing protein 1-like isoform X2 [Syngnathus acus]
MSALLDNFPEHNCTDFACHWAALQTSFGDLKANQTSQLSARRLLLAKVCQEIRSDKGLWNQELKEKSSWALTGSMSSLQKKVVDLPILYRKLKAFMPRDCTDVMAEGNFQDGVYLIFGGFNTFEVYCDMNFDGGGWTVIQRRQDGSVSFARKWDAYENGFGIITGEHWLGLRNIYSLTVLGGYQLRIDVTQCDGSKYFALYDDFSVGLNLLDPEKDGYPLLANGYSGNAGNGLVTHSGMKFSTSDRDQDGREVHGENCAAVHDSGWWYNNCGNTDLNGVFSEGYDSKMKWSKLDPLRFVETKIRPNKAPTCRCCRKSH